jgi:hypothetical protein
LAIRNYHNSGNTAVIRVPLALLATFLHRLGRDEPAATIAGYPFNRFTAGWVPEQSPTITHLRDVLGDQTYESLARTGETMTTPAMVTYAIRPNRPGPSRTERGLEIDDRRESVNGVSSPMRAGGSSAFPLVLQPVRPVIGR